MTSTPKTSTPRRDEVEDMDFDLVFNQPHLTPVKDTKLENKRIIRGKMPMPLKLPKGPVRPEIRNYDDYLKMIDSKDKKKGGKFGLRNKHRALTYSKTPKAFTSQGSVPRIMSKYGGKKTRKNRKNRKNKKGGFDPDKGLIPSIPPKRDRDEAQSRNEKVIYYYNLLLLVDSIIPNMYLKATPTTRRPFNRVALGRIMGQIKRYTDELLDRKTQELHDLLRSNHPLLPNLPAGHEELSFEDRMEVINDFHRQVPGGPVEGHHGGVLGKKKKKTKKIVKRKKNKRRKSTKRRKTKSRLR
jgi:hypothetical protein